MIIEAMDDHGNRDPLRPLDADQLGKSPDAMNDQRLAQTLSEGDLQHEHRLLFARKTDGESIETALAYGDDFFVTTPFAQACHADLVIRNLRQMPRMYPHGKISMASQRVGKQIDLRVEHRNMRPRLALVCMDIDAYSGLRIYQEFTVRLRP